MEDEMEEREILSFIISCCVMAFVLFQWSNYRKLPYSKLLFGCFAVLFTGWSFSIIEELAWETGFNFLQHLCSGISGILLAVWCRAIYLSGKHQGTAK